MGQQIDPQLLAAIMAQESGGNPNAVSPAGAQGLMQIMPSTARDPGYGLPNIFGLANDMGIQYGGESDAAIQMLLRNPQLNKAFGDMYFGKMMELSGGNTQNALARYNAGPGAVDRYGGVPPFAETQDYVKNVMARFQPSPPQPMAQPAPAPLPTGGAMQGNFGNTAVPLSDPASMLAKQSQQPPNVPNVNQNPVNPYTNPEVLGATAAPAAGIASEMGQFFKSTPGIMSSVAALANTDFEDPASIGANAGSVAGAAFGSTFGPVGTAIGSVGGSFLGDTIGGLFGDSKQEKAEKEAKEKAEKQHALNVMDSMTRGIVEAGYDRRKALENIAKKLGYQ